jgi:serine/threonine protein kinase
VQTFREDGLPDQITFEGQSYQFDQQLGNGANGVAVRYLPMTGGGPGIVLKATRNPDENELAAGVADRAMVAKVGKEFANHLHAMGDVMQGHPHLLAARGIILSQSPSETVQASVATYARRRGEDFSPTHLANSVSLFTVMEEAGPGPLELVKDINLLRLTGTISEATHGLLMRSLFAQMVEGCAHLEDRQIAHRDIKLENMLLSNDGRVLIMDLGEGDVGRLTQPAPINVGSEMTQSPELHHHSSGARKVDTWALGVVWRQMSNSLNEADPREATILSRRDGDMTGRFDLSNDRREWAANSSNAVHRPEELSRTPTGASERLTPGNLDGVEQLTNAMLHPDQAQRPTLAALRNHHAIADPVLQDPRLLELTRAIQTADGIKIAHLNQSLTASAGRAGPGASG